MRKFPFVIIGIWLFCGILCQLGLTGCKSNSNNCQQDTIRDTVSIYDDYQLDEDFYNLYHPDSVKVAIPEGFTYYSDYEVRKYGRFRPQLAYALGIMLPKASYPHSSEIARWVIKRVEDDEAFRDVIEDLKNSPNMIYKGNLYNGREIFDYMANRFFQYIDNEDMAESIAYHDGISMTVACSSPRFITYREDTDCFWGGAHGMRTEKYLTLDVTSDKELKNSDIFRNEYIDSIKSALYKVASLDSAYREAHNHKPGEDISDVFKDDNGNFDLPQAALLEKGVVFSFQPYEISGYGQGCFHFVIPYSSIMHYLAPRAKALLKKTE